MKRTNLILAALIVSVFSFLWTGCDMNNVLRDVRGDWRMTNMGGNNSVASLQITSEKVYCSAAKGYGSWNDEGSYTFDSDTITFNLRNGGSTTYEYQTDEKTYMEIKYLSGDGRKLIEGRYDKNASIDW